MSFKRRLISSFSWLHHYQSSRCLCSSILSFQAFSSCSNKALRSPIQEIHRGKCNTLAKQPEIKKEKATNFYMAQVNNNCMALSWIMVLKALHKYILLEAQYSISFSFVFYCLGKNTVAYGYTALTCAITRLWPSFVVFPGKRCSLHLIEWACIDCLLILTAYLSDESLETKSL